MSEQNQTMLPGHTTAGLSYKVGARYVLLAGGVGALVLAILIGTLPVIALGVGIALTTALVSAPALNGRKLIYQLLLESYGNVKLRKRKGKLGSRSVESLLYEDETGNRQRLSANRVTVNFLPLDDKGEEYLTEIYTPHNKLHTLMVVVDSWGDAVASSPDTVEAHAQALSEILKSLSKGHGIGLKAALSFVRVPYDSNEAQAWLESRQAHVDTNDPSLLKLRASFKEAVQTAHERGSSFICFATISTYRPGNWSRLDPSQLPFNEIVKSKAYKLTEELINRLDSIGVQGVHRPDPYESALLLRGNLDVVDLPNLYRDAFVDRRSKGIQGHRTIEDSMVLAEGALPDGNELVARRTYLEVAGSTYTATLFSPGFTRRRTDPAYMQHALQLPPGLWGSITLIFTTAPARTEEYRQQWNRWENDSRRWRQGSRGSSMRAKDRDQSYRIEEEDEALYLSDGDAIHLNLLVTVSTDNPNELKDAIDALKNSFRTTIVPLREIKGDTQQWDARLAALGIPTGNK